MPNWCFNSVAVSHEDPAMIERFVAAANSGKLFNEFVPMPEELRGTESPSEVNEAFVEKYGHSDWYGWALANWGTKWDIAPADFVSDGKAASGGFDTAWSPPIAFYDALLEQGFEVSATYTEEGMGFAGHYDDGVDYCIDLAFTDGPNDWIDQIENEVLRDIVVDQYDMWLEYRESESEAVA